MSQRILIIGATSAIATAVARLYAMRSARLFLVARRPESLSALAADLRVRGAAEVAIAPLDVNDIDQHSSILEQAWNRWPGIDAVLVAHGVLPDQARCEMSVKETLAVFDTNGRSTIALLTALGARFADQSAGVLAVISSPAGDRGRASNYVYGAGKAAVSVFAAGLRHRLHARGVRVLTILPGFVDTPMTAAIAKGPLWAQPETVAADIVMACDRGLGTVYTPWFWRWIMFLIRHLPESLFVKTRL
ncbi:MAG: short-chain dehydrogenase [Herminiimonas sp.]|nr:short-chain dehydrogenase [Herminiimonas sp.]